MRFASVAALSIYVVGSALAYLVFACWLADREDFRRRGWLCVVVTAAAMSVVWPLSAVAVFAPRRPV